MNPEIKAVCDSIRAKLTAASKGEPETWCFVAMFMKMIDTTEKEATRAWVETRTRLPEDGQRVWAWQRVLSDVYPAKYWTARNNKPDGFVEHDSDGRFWITDSVTHWMPRESAPIAPGKDKS